MRPCQEHEDSKPPGGGGDGDRPGGARALRKSFELSEEIAMELGVSEHLP